MSTPHVYMLNCDFLRKLITVSFVLPTCTIKRSTWHFLQAATLASRWHPRREVGVKDGFSECPQSNKAYIMIYVVHKPNIIIHTYIYT